MSANIIKEWKCPYCKETFSTRRQKEDHTKSCSQKPKYSWICNYCGEEFSSRQKLAAHKKENHYNGMSNGGYEKSIEALQKGHIKFLHKCPFCKKEWEVSECTFSLHVNHCKENPNAIKYKGHSWSEEQRKKISECMKKAHAEGRAGTFPSRKDNAMSYPEKWFVGVAEREGITGYVRELKFHRFFLDFAWPEKKFCIEIDGEQHQRFEDRKRNDLEKDRLLKEEGWTELRVSWSWLCKNTQRFIDAVKNNLNSLKDLEVNKLSLSYIGVKEERKLMLQEKRAEAEKNGTLASNGHLSANKLSFEEWSKRKELIEKANVDLTKFGCIAELVRKTGLTKRQVEKTLKHFSMRP